MQTDFISICIIADMLCTLWLYHYAHTLPIKGFESIKRIEEVNKEMYQIRILLVFLLYILNTIIIQ